MKKAAAFLFSILLLSSFCSAGAETVYENSSSFPSISAEAVLAVDLGADKTSDKDDTVLYAKNETEKLYPASLVKIMTAVIIFENIPAADIQSKTATMSQEVKNEVFSAGASNAGLIVGEEMPIKELLYCMLLPSGADAALILARLAANDSVATFIQKMNDKATALGMSDTHFTNVTGLHDANEYTTAHDLRILTTYALYQMQDNELFRQIVSSPSFQLSATNKQPARTIYSTNNLLKSSDTKIDGIVGVKTGTTTPAGQCLVSHYVKDNFDLLVITLKSTPEVTSFKDQNLIYQWVLKNFSFLELSSLTFPELTINVGRASKPRTTPLAIRSTEKILFPTEQKDKLSISAGEGKSFDKIKAPLKLNEVVMPAAIMYNGKSLAEVQLVSTEAISMGFQYYLLYALFIIIPILLIIIIITVIFKVKKAGNRRRRRRIR